MWFIFALSQFIVSSCALGYFFRKDRQTEEDNTWNQKKLYPYDSIVWINWREAAMVSFQNCIITCIPLYCTWKYSPEVFEVNNNVIWRWISYYLTAETYFYFIHRAMHSIPFIRKIHLHHHSTTNTVAASFFDSSHFEHILLNIGTIFTPLYLVGASQTEFFLFFNFGILSSCISHSGYVGNSDRHFLHHKVYNKNFGFGVYFWDKIMGTLALN